MINGRLRPWPPSRRSRNQHPPGNSGRFRFRIIENRGYLVRCLHLSSAPSDVVDQTLSKSNPPAPQGHSRVTTRPHPQLIGGSGAEPSPGPAFQALLTSASEAVERSPER